MEPLKRLAQAVRSVSERVHALESKTFVETDSIGALLIRELSADPDDPPEGSMVLWMSDGTDSGDAGDIIIKITSGGVTKSTTIADFSLL